MVIDLTVTLKERRRMLDQADQAIADIRDCFHQGSRNAGTGSFDYLSQSRGKRLRRAAPSGQAGTDLPAC